MIDLNKSGVYCIQNIKDQKRYIGSAVKFNARFWRHKYALNLNKHSNLHLQRAWSKYKENMFLLFPILYCEKKDLYFYEQRAIDAYKTTDERYGYNLCPVAGSRLGFKLSGVALCNVTNGNKGKNKGIKRSDEFKEKLSIAHAGKKLTERHKMKIRNSLSGRVMSDEERKSHIIYPTEETRAKLLESWKSAERHKKMSLYQLAHSSRRGKIVSAETRQKMRKSKLGKVPWNKGHTVNSDIRVKQYVDKIKNTYTKDGTK